MLPTNAGAAKKKIGSKTSNAEIRKCPRIEKAKQKCS
jgi:hypothetical protein